jgi:DNA-binding HxlR family transcriptional regulator
MASITLMIFSFVGVFTRGMLTLRRVSSRNRFQTSPRTVLRQAATCPSPLLALVFSTGADGLEKLRYNICTTCGYLPPWESVVNDQTKQGSYGQFCPVAMAAEIICSRWTALILREMLCGTTRFNDLRRGVPLMSPTLLSKRLKELTEAGVIAVKRTGKQGAVEYTLTEAGEDLRAVIMSLGTWGQRWVESSLSLKNLDPSLLMWDMRRNLVASLLPDRRCTVKFTYPELNAGRKSWWIVKEGDDVDLCSVDPGYDVDLYVSASLHAMTAVWMGASTLKAEVDAGTITLTGEKTVARSMQQWLGLSPFAAEKSRVAS